MDVGYGELENLKTPFQLPHYRVMVDAIKAAAGK
jgi:hypothetical protein